ncbi:MAG: hypothetical protein AB7F39_19795, partial [Variibacter sp.]
HGLSCKHLFSRLDYDRAIRRTDGMLIRLRARISGDNDRRDQFSYQEDTKTREPFESVDPVLPRNPAERARRRDAWILSAS